jgi:sugar O-acyltransferase (sialic acid O-acetyltransferase NeuD family)
MTNKPRCIILGNGGHAHVLIDALRLSDAAEIAGVLDMNGQGILDIPNLGDDSLLPTMKEKGITHFVVGVGSVGLPDTRIRLYNIAKAYDLSPLTIIHPQAICSPYARIEEGSQILAAAIINIFASLGENVIINTGAIVEHDCVVENHVHIATGALLCGGVHVGAHSHIGAGAVIRQSIEIGENVIVGAGAVVVKDVPSNTTVVGNPARVYLKD